MRGISSVATELIFISRLEAVGKDWNVFYHDASWALILSRLRTSSRMERVLPFEYFHKAAREGHLPAYSWLGAPSFSLPLTESA